MNQCLTNFFCGDSTDCSFVQSCNIEQLQQSGYKCVDTSTYQKLSDSDVTLTWDLWLPTSDSTSATYIETAQTLASSSDYTSIAQTFSAEDCLNQDVTVSNLHFCDYNADETCGASELTSLVAILFAFGFMLF